MDDFDLIEKKARMWMEDAKDLDSLSKAAQVLRDVDERRKKTSTKRPLSEKVLVYTTLFSALGLLVTAGTAFYNLEQGIAAAQAQEDSQWRTAVEKCAPGSKTPSIGALEMKSFFRSKRYGKESRTVAATLLRNIDDNILFDDIFFDLVNVGKSKQNNDQELIALAKILSSQLNDRYKGRMEKLKQGDRPRNHTFAHFLEKPDDFYDDSKHPEQKKEEEQIDADIYRLDTISKGLIDIWKDPHFNPSKAEVDLEEIVFLNGDYSGIDFSVFRLKGAGFYGGCVLTGVKFGDVKPGDHCEQGEPNQKRETKRIVAVVSNDASKWSMQRCYRWMEHALETCKQIWL